MADQDDSSRTEMPTGKRLNQSYDKGEFPRATEIDVVFILIAAFAYLSFMGPSLARQVADFSAFILRHLADYQMTVTSVSYFLPELFKMGLLMILPFMLVCFAAAVAAGGVQTKFHLKTEMFTFDINKLNPVDGLKNMFNVDRLVQFGVSLMKFGVVVWVLWGVVKKIQQDPIFYSSVSAAYLAEFIFRTFMSMLLHMIFAIGLIAILNYAYAKWRFIEQRKMTKQEVADEMKNAEGNPQIKSAQRRFARQMAYRQILTKIPLADVIVTNPTHFAVALKYERGRDAAPVVIAKGKDLLAQRIKQIARKHDVPMVENRPVARALYKQAQVGKIIPTPLFAVVAQILAFVYRTHRYYFHRLRARRMEASA